MRNKRKMIALLTSICTVFSCVPAYALDMDLSYSYKTESKDEFPRLFKGYFRHYAPDGV